MPKNKPTRDDNLSDEDKGVMAYGSPAEQEALRARRNHGSLLAAAEQLGIEPRSVSNHIYRMRKRAASRGYAPAHDMVQTVPAGFHVKGVSTYYDRDGNPKGQWVKSTKDRDTEIETMLEAFKGALEPYKGKSTKAKAPKGTNADLMTVYPMGDPHIGMFSWAVETGEDFDLEIAEQQLVQAVDHLVGLAPPSDQALIINLGDFFHADNQMNRTMASGHALDVDSRWAKVLMVGIRIMTRCIDRALEKHKSVRVINAIGNHDDHSSVFLAAGLALFYTNNKRVFIDKDPTPYHWHRFGANLIGVTHGHKTKKQDLGPIMAQDRAKDWGETVHRYWYTGHIHHDSLREYPGVIVESFRTLAAKDAWHNAAGYRSGRDMKVDVFHKEHGRINRHIVGVGQIEQQLMAKKTK